MSMSQFHHFKGVMEYMNYSNRPLSKRIC